MSLRRVNPVRDRNEKPIAQALQQAGDVVQVEITVVNEGMR